MGRALKYGEDEAVSQTIGERIRAARKLRGLTMRELGEALELSIQQVHKYESGSNRVSVPVLLRIAQTLELPLTHFLPEIEAAADAPADADPDVLEELEPDEVETLLAVAEAPAALRRALVQMVRTVFDEMRGLPPARTA